MLRSVEVGQARCRFVDVELLSASRRFRLWLLSDEEVTACRSFSKCSEIVLWPGQSKACAKKYVRIRRADHIGTCVLIVRLTEKENRSMLPF